MNGKDLKRIRRRLNLTQEQMATLLGYEGGSRRAVISLIESGKSKLRAPQRRLVSAYVDGYRPKDWPQGDANA